MSEVFCESDDGEAEVPPKKPVLPLQAPQRPDADHLDPPKPVFPQSGAVPKAGHPSMETVDEF